MSDTAQLELYTGKERCRIACPLGTSGVAFSPGGRFVVVTDGGMLRTADLAVGTVVQSLRAHRQLVSSLAFTRDGRLLATGSFDQTVALWRVAPENLWRTHRTDLKPADLEGLWKDLAGDDAARAHRAIWALVKGKPALPFLKARLQQLPVVATGDLALHRLLAGLDDNSFQVREKATRELSKFGLQLEPVLRRLLDKKPSAEARQRLQTILTRLAPRPDHVLWLRALEALELTGTDAACETLAELAAAGGELAWEAREAQRRLTAWRATQ